MKTPKRPKRFRTLTSYTASCMPRVLAPIFLSGMVGCLFPTLDELTSPDATAVDSSIPDAPNDVTANDTSIIDAPADALDAHAPFCATYADAGASTFCQDFDSITDAAVLAPVVSSLAQFELDTNDWATPPASLLVTIAPSDSGAPLHASAQYATGFTPTAITLDFQMKVSSVATSPANAATLTFSANREMIFAVTDSGFFLEESTPLADGGTPNVLSNHPVVSFPWDNSWHLVTIVISFTANTSTITVDGQKLENDFSLLGNWSSVGSVTLGYGVSYTPTGPWKIGQDNILLRMTP